MATRLKLEWGDGDELIITKKKGKITFDEVIRFMHEQEQLFNFDGELMVFQFRVSEAHDMIDYAEEVFGEREGDMIVLQRVGDESICPVCGEKRIFPQYCPDCGRKLEEPIKRNQK
ncbi:MAG: hypothetical protein II008_15935 [Oscillospiraceae bacterium]|nr:hypothetical protein [Oscillospiraceae bacterium]